MCQDVRCEPGGGGAGALGGFGCHECGEDERGVGLSAPQEITTFIQQKQGFGLVPLLNPGGEGLEAFDNGAERYFKVEGAGAGWWI